MEESALRHRRAEEEDAMNGIQVDDVYRPRKHLKGKILTPRRIFLGFVALISVALLYQYELIRIPFLSSTSTWRPLPTRGKSTSGVDTEKRDAIVAAFKHSWSAYEKDAMGADEYHPITHRGSNFSSRGGIGYMVIDAIDTMYLMGLKDEYNRARDWLSSRHTFDRDENFNTFETTIRVLGGLLSIFHLTKDNLYLEKATDLADRMLPIFDTPSGLPLSMANLGLQKGVDDPYRAGLVSTAEATTLQLEFRYLSHVTGNDIYWDKVEKVMSIIKKSEKPWNLVPIYMNANTGLFLDSEIRLGSRGDSYYEYLLKQYLQTNQTEHVYREMYDAAMQGVHDKLLVKGAKNGLTLTAELLPTHSRDPQNKYTLSRKQDHLVCFLGGSLMLGATTVGSRNPNVSRPPRESQLTSTGKRDWKTGYELIETCVDTHNTATGLSPEIVYFYSPEEVQRQGDEVTADWYIKGARRGAWPVYDARYILRPETVESIFLAYRMTGDMRYRKIGWKIFKSIEKYCRLEEGGYASVLNVDDTHSQKDDKMETFWLSETLKYLYLLFEDESVIPLDEYVFNTEAHPLPVFTPNRPLANF
ncbi:glycoside hydrolase family 47 protein [Macrolepiota fuliginosa MF-IS2]|uniref:alpha-1,2-Mannosidase n=1 Tax=Macrolepiota fuliginosa MF-IS2 TaxID=1400762 RepID=A0A9P5XHH2_9AGAR|nr:glycoside hydrolase family 47 protein [Macrolepiota fuliginosa MF-IS2]